MYQNYASNFLVLWSYKLHKTSSDYKPPTCSEHYLCMDYGPWQWWRHAETGIERFWVWMAEHPALERLWLRYHSRCVACVVTVITWVQYIKLHSNMKTMWMIRLTNEQHTTLYKLSTFCFLCILCIIVMNPVLFFKNWQIPVGCCWEYRAA